MRILIVLLALLLYLPVCGQDTLILRYELMEYHPRKLKVKFRAADGKIIKKTRFSEGWYPEPHWVSYRLIVESGTRRINAKIKYPGLSFENLYNFSLEYRGKEDITIINPTKTSLRYVNAQPHLYTRHPQWIGVVAKKNLAVDTVSFNPTPETISFLSKHGLQVDSVVVDFHEWESIEPDGSRISEKFNQVIFLIGKMSGENFQDTDPLYADLRNAGLFHSVGPVIDETYGFHLMVNELVIHWINPDKDKAELFRKYNLREGENAFESSSDRFGYTCKVILADDYGYKITDILSQMNSSGDFIASAVTTLAVEYHKINYFDK